MRNRIVTTTIASLLALVSLAAANDAAPMLSYCWANGIVYGIVIPSNSKTSGGMRNELYVFRNLTGQRPVAEAAPGDLNYQNGRFETVFLDFTPKGIEVLDPNNDGFCEFEITNGQMVHNYLKQGYLKLGGRGSLIDIKLVPPDLYKDGMMPPTQKDAK